MVGNSKKGFTIIEIMIVLALASLILLIVFLAVPAMQRNARNTNRNKDIVSLAQALYQARANRNDLPPATCSNTDNGCFVNEPSLGYYSGKSIIYRQLAGPNNWGPLMDTDSIRIFNYMKCAANYDWAADGNRTNASGHMAQPTGANINTYVMLYAVEGASGTIVPMCRDF